MWKEFKAQYEAGASNFPNYTIVPSHCENYTACDLWREDKEKEWKRKLGKKYSSFEKSERITA